MLIIHKDLTCNRASPLLKKKWGNKYANFDVGVEKSFLRKECQLASAGPRKRRSTSNSNERGGTLARDKQADQLGGEHSTWKCVQEKERLSNN
jgi:hypothetical protein